MSRSARPIIFYDRSIFNGGRTEDVWLDK